MKIALAIICKGTDEEAKLLDRCLGNVSPYVDGIFVTATYPNNQIENSNITKTIRKYNGNYSEFVWVNDFSKARNFNFSQVPKEYDYILWCDSDDMFRGLEKLQPTLQENPTIDAFAFWYLYEFDENKQPVVVHKKTQVVRNDSCIEWKGLLHEDLMPTRAVETKFVEGMERMHFTNEERIQDSRKRNVIVSQNDVTLHPDDPRTYFNLGNSLIGDGQYEEAQKALTKFIELTGSPEERYIATLRLAMIEDAIGNRDEAVKQFQIAIGMQPTYSDAYLQLGHLYLSYDDIENAEHYLLNGMIKKPPYHNVIVFNPREYDFKPMNALAKVYFKKNRPDLALPMLEGCLKIYPDNKELKALVKEMQKETKRLEKVITIVQSLESETDLKKIEWALAKVPKDLKSHPAICSIRNKHFVKTESSGKDITYYCGLTVHEWNPEMAKTKGIGGSEEAVINLSKEWAKQGYNVTVYNNCGPEQMICDGVIYKPFWEYNYRNKTDYTIIWRHPKLLDYELNTTKVYVDLHDVISAGEFNEKRLEKVDKIFVKTEFHHSLFPKVPDSKIAVVPNGMDFELFNQKIKKDRYLLVNTSSPDRSMDVLPELFKRVKKEVPKARLAWAYGWEIFDNSNSSDKKMMIWKKKIETDMKEAGIENLGRLSQKECAKLYLEGNILAYPTEFAEIDCITVKKAQACGCMPITTDFGALNESVQYGEKVHSMKNKNTWSQDGKMSFGIEDENMKTLWVNAVVAQLRKPLTERKKMKEWSRKFEWSKISNLWINEF